MTDQAARPEKSKGQSTAEMALALPIILLLALGVFELGRIVIIFSSVNNASREAARFGAATGTTLGGDPRYLACAAIRQQAQQSAPIAGLTDDDIQIAYDTSSGGGLVRYAKCGDAGLTADDVQLGDRIVVTVTRKIDPILSIFPSFNPTFVTARTILKNIVIGPTECSDGADNDGDGLIDYPADDGCTSPEDTIEAKCYRLSLIASPPNGGTMSINPEPNCSNRYIETTIVNLQAFKDIRTEYYTDTLYTFSHWTGITTTAVTDNPTTVRMDANKDVIAHFRLLTSDLSVTKSSLPGTVSSQKSFSYQISVSNPYTDTARNVVITDTLPLGVDYTNVWGWSSTTGTETATCSELVTDSIIGCTLSELAVGHTATFNFEIISPVVDFAPVTLTNIVTVSAFEYDSNLANNTAAADTVVTPRAELSMLDKADSADPVYAREPYIYLVSVKNWGPSVATGVNVTDILTGGLDFISSATCIYDNPIRTVSCPLGDLTAGATRTVTFTVNAPAQGPSVSNLATVSSSEAEENTADNSASEDTVVINHANLNIDKSGPASAYRDAAFDYTLKVTNSGPSTAENVVITDTLPIGMQYNTSLTPSGTCIHNSANNTVVCAVNDLDAVTGLEIYINTTPIITGTLVNEVVVGSVTEDKDLSNNGDSVPTTVEAQVILSISKTAPLTVSHGDSFTYTIQAENSGLSTATDVSVSDLLPNGIDYISHGAPDDWSCSYDNVLTEAVTCTPDNGILKGESQVTITINVFAASVGSHTNSVTLSSAKHSASDSNVTEVNPSLDLSVDIDGPGTATVGSPFTYTITLDNSGPSAATIINVTSLLSPDVIFSSLSVVSGVSWLCEYQAINHRVVCTVGTMAAETQASFAISIEPTNDATVTSQASVLANESLFDTNPANNSASIETDVD